MKSESLGDVGLSPREDAAATLIAAGKTTAQVAEELDVKPRLVTLWRSKPAFRRVVTARIAAAQEEAADLHRIARLRAIQVLVEDLESFDARLRNSTARFVVEKFSPDGEQIEQHSTVNVQVNVAQLTEELDARFKADWRK